MRSEQQCRQLFGAGAPAENISRRIDANFERRLFHEIHDVGACVELSLGKTKAGDTAFGIAAELTQLLECALETFGVDMTRRGGRGLGACGVATQGYHQKHRSDSDEHT